MKKKIVNSIAIISILVLSVLGIYNTYLYTHCNKEKQSCLDNVEYITKSCDTKAEELKKQVADKEAEIKKLNSTIKSQKSTISKLETENKNLKKK